MQIHRRGYVDARTAQALLRGGRLVLDAFTQIH
jgi:hypothetical protein